MLTTQIKAWIFHSTCHENCGTHVGGSFCTPLRPLLISFFRPLSLRLLLVQPKDHFPCSFRVKSTKDAKNHHRPTAENSDATLMAPQENRVKEMKKNCFSRMCDVLSLENCRDSFVKLKYEKKNWTRNLRVTLHLHCLLIREMKNSQQERFHVLNAMQVNSQRGI